MGQHKNNGLSALAKQARGGDILPLAAAVTSYSYQYAFECVIEPNKEKAAEITAFLDAELAAGKAPEDINTRFELTPADQDFVVYHQIQQGRKLITVDQIAVARIRGPEHFRMPLAEVMARAQQAFDGGPSKTQA